MLQVMWGEMIDDCLSFTDLCEFAQLEQSGLCCTAGNGQFPLSKLWRGVKQMSVELRPGESQESILRRFRKAVAEARILPIVRQKRWFTSKSEIRRIKRQKAIRKSQRTLTGEI